MCGYGPYLQLQDIQYANQVIYLFSEISELAKNWKNTKTWLKKKFGEGRGRKEVYDTTEMKCFEPVFIIISNPIFQWIDDPYFNFKSQEFKLNY